MAVCAITNRKRMVGNNVSHANNKTKRTFKLNMQTKRFQLKSGRTIKVRLSARAIRTIDKLGSIEAALLKLTRKDIEEV